MENDLISRRALLLELRESRSKERLPIPMYNVLSLAIGKVVDAPTIAAVPVVHGTWESFTTSAFVGMGDDGDPRWADRRFFVHKKCGRRSAIKEKYCPSCGARMDEEEAK